MATEIKLRAKVKYEDVEKEVLVLDLESLSGDDITEIIKSAERDNGGTQIPVAALDPNVQRRAAAKAAGVQPGLIGKLGAKDFLEVTGATRDFLLDL
jgi:hypothetical protein